jgi:MFS family permease
MADLGTGEQPTRASRVVSVSQKAAKGSVRAARVGGAVVNGTGRIVHRLTRASGAGQTGLSNLIELSIAGGIGDAFVLISLAGTLFFNSSAEQARGRAAFALIVTIAPYAILAPLVGPMLDRVRRGNKYILIGTLLARGLLCWGMAGAVEHNDAVTLLPAALGVLVLQKAYAVTKSAVTPRLLPSGMTLVSANSRFNLASLLTTSVGAGLALGIDKVLGDHSVGAAWVLRLAMVIYLAAMAVGLRLPDRVDDDQVTDQETEAAANGAAAQPGPTATRPYTVPGTTQAAPARRPFAIPKLGPAVFEAMEANATVRVFYGFMISFLAFILRTEKFGHVSDKIALGGLAAVIAIGGILGTGIGSLMRSRAPQLLIFVVLVVSVVVTITGAFMFGLPAVLLVALGATIAQTLVKASLDSILQREVPEERRSSAFSFSETIHQLALVIGGLIGIALSLTNSGLTGLTVAAVGLSFALCALLLSRRRRVLRSHPARSTG